MTGRTEEVLIGHVGVDAGMVFIGDPCYWIGDDCSARELPEMRDWGKFLEKHVFEKGGHTSNHGTIPYPEDITHDVGGMGHEGMAVWANSGFGDGSYPVYATISDEGQWGKRVQSLRIEFMEDEE